jgi:hypothetical protein
MLRAGATAAASIICNGAAINTSASKAPACGAPCGRRAE